MSLHVIAKTHLQLMAYEYTSGDRISVGWINWAHLWKRAKSHFTRSMVRHRYFSYNIDNISINCPLRLQHEQVLRGEAGWGYCQKYLIVYKTEHPGIVMLLGYWWR